MDRYLTLAVEYEPHATDAQRSLGWLAPELVDANLTITDDVPGVRRWAGVIDGDTYERFVDSWGGEAHIPSNCQELWIDRMRNVRRRPPRPASLPRRP